MQSWERYFRTSSVPSAALHSVSIAFTDSPLQPVSCSQRQHSMHVQRLLSPTTHTSTQQCQLVSGAPAPPEASYCQCPTCLDSSHHITHASPPCAVLHLLLHRGRIDEGPEQCPARSTHWYCCGRRLATFALHDLGSTLLHRVPIPAALTDLYEAAQARTAAPAPSPDPSAVQGATPGDPAGLVHRCCARLGAGGMADADWACLALHAPSRLGATAVPCLDVCQEAYWHTAGHGTLQPRCDIAVAGSCILHACRPPSGTRHGSTSRSHDA